MLILLRLVGTVQFFIPLRKYHEGSEVRNEMKIIPEVYIDEINYLLFWLGQRTFKIQPKIKTVGSLSRIGALIMQVDWYKHDMMTWIAYV